VIVKQLVLARPGGSLAPLGSRVSALIGLVALVGGCGRQQAAPASAPAASPPPVGQVAPGVQAAPQALVFRFSEPEPWKARSGDSVVQPPDMNAETWRVLVNQTEPIQRKTPQWQALPARETVELAMPAGSKFRCMVPPLNVSSEGDDFGKHLEAWNFRRSFLCSTDDFRSWTETTLQVRMLPDGTRKVGAEAGLLLRDRSEDGAVRETYVLMRSDKEKLHATQGPPQIVADRAADDK
jgi:hypothetical protein